MVNIIRDNNALFLHQSELLVGDLVQVDSGMEIPADGILVLAAEVSCDESAMTGNFLLNLWKLLNYKVKLFLLKKIL